MPENFQNEPKVKTWIKTVEKTGCRVKGIEPVKTISKPGRDMLFALARADVRDPDGNRLLPYVLIRGHACVIVPKLFHSGTGEERFIMVRQRRIGNGHYSLEFPAGMLDCESDPQAVAIKEMKEETGLDVGKEALFPLHPGPLYSSAGLCDEGIYYFGCEMKLDAAEWEDLEGRTMGVPAEGEYIRVELWKASEAVKQVTSLQTRLGFYLFRDLKNGVAE
jgi:8-oxo-dGTP pyrophosphatase MutT (NUDIX family)